MGKKSGLTPGTKAPYSGEWQQIGPRGGKGEEVTVPKGHRLPPAPEGSTYKLVRPAHNNSGRK
jgi:hypothetical protein